MAIPQIKRGSVGGTDVKRGNNGYQSWRVFNPETSVDLVKPSTNYYDKDLKARVAQQEPMIVHIAPSLVRNESGEGCAIEEYRYGTGDRDFTPWALVLPMANSWGYKSIPSPGQEDSKINDSLTWITSSDMDDARNTIEAMLYRRCLAAYKSGKIVRGRDGESIDPRTEWPGLNKDVSYMKQWFSNPTRGNAFMRVGVLNTVSNQVSDGNAAPLGYNQSDIPQIMMLSTATSNKLFKTLNAANEDFNPMAREDYGSNFKLGDVTCICPDAKYAVIYMKGKQDYISAAFAPDEYGNAPSQEVSSDGFQSYDVNFHETVYLPFSATRSRFKVDGSAVNNDSVRSVLENSRPLYEYFDVPEDEQRAEYLAQAFAKVPSLLSYGMADNPEFFAYSGVRAILNNTSQVACAGNIQDDDEATAAPAASVGSPLSAENPFKDMEAPATPAPAPAAPQKKVVKKAIKRVVKPA